MASKVAICNQALGHLGISKLIASISENSQEARALNLYYDDGLADVLRSFPWPFARRIVSLALVEEDPNDEWSFSYRVPVDCLLERRVPSGIRNDARKDRVPYLIGGDEQGGLIFCDREDAQLEYTALITDPQRFPPDFVTAFSYYLAAKACPQLTAGDPFKLQANILKLFSFFISNAEANAGNAQQVDLEPDAQRIQARE